MNGEEYRELNDADYTRFRRNLLRSKGGSRQQEFLKIVQNDKDFLDHIRERTSTDGSHEPPIYPERLTENEFKDPPSSTEIELFRNWAGLTPRLACRTTFWANLTCRHIEDKRISAVYLAANGGTHHGGAERIDRVLQSFGPNSVKPIDDCVRTVLRRLSGLPEARGNRTVYVDCPLARAWWRERLIAEISQGHTEKAEKVRVVTRLSQTYWETLVTLVVSRNSVLGSEQVRHAFIMSLADMLANEPKSPLRITKELRLACRTISIVQASRELSILDERRNRFCHGAHLVGAASTSTRQAA